MDTLHFNNINNNQKSQVQENFEMTPVQEFYRDSKILITGSTGFLGKILVEKLLRSCQGISTVYLLVRSKKGKNVHTRCEEIFDDLIFDRLKRECPKFRHKVVCVAGDCCLPDLGISLQDRKMLIDEVDIIFHVAATVRFDEKLKTALAINVRATKDILNLAKEMSKLRSIMHVSTAFANCTSKVIEEKIYPVSIDYKKLLTLADSLPEKMLDNLTPTILDKYPNTYAYTKQVAEDVVKQCSEGLPIGILRPSIVVSTYKEPIKAWINNMYGATGICAGAGLGVLRILYCDPDSNANIVPVDMCVNSLIAAAWETGVNFQEARNEQKEFEMKVYNYESSNDKPIDWKYFMYRSQVYGLRTPSIKAIWYYSFRLQKSYFLYYFMRFFLHILPSLIVDGALLCIGKSPRMMKVYSKVHKFAAVISYFSTQAWTFKSENVQKLCKKMSPKDNEIFFSDLNKLDWDEFFQLYLRGVRIYLIQDSIDSLDEALVRWKRLYWAHQTVKAVLAVLILKIFWTLLSSFSYKFYC